VGSKPFTESYVLAEIAKGLLQREGFEVDHRQGLGKTIIIWQALRTGDIDVYPEYTGTISEEILKKKLDRKQMEAELNRRGIGITGDLGFNNTYALTMRREKAESLGIKKISDLRQHPGLVVGITHEFKGRADGWEPLVKTYGLNMADVKGIEHTLAYTAMKAGQIDITDAYSTDSQIAQNDLVVLQDDLGYFPQYRAVFLYRITLDPKAIKALKSLEGRLNEAKMIQLNSLAEEKKDYAAAAASVLNAKHEQTDQWRQIVIYTGQHLRLVGVSLLITILVGIPLGIWASRPGWMSQVILTTVGVVQTIPSLALLALLVAVPGFGVSAQTAILALFLYGLLPIVRNTATGLQDIPSPLRESAAALGLSKGAQLRLVYLPMALPTILAGVKTSAVINVGTATLAALIGQQGLGEPIISGLNLSDPHLILQGAIPAAVLAILVQLAFDLLDRAITPRGLRLRSG